jgi:F-type H+-transporting ATPase subunit b
MRRFITLAAATLPWSLAASASEGAPNSSLLIQPQFGTIFWTVVTFVILAFLLGKFAWKPLLAAVEARETGIRDAIEGAKRGREEAERLLGEHKAMLDLARKERADAVEAGRRDAERLKAEILDEARKQREQMMKQAAAQVEAGLRQARAELKGEAADLAIRAAGKLLGKNLDDQTQRRIVEDYFADLERLGPAPGSRPS